MEANGWTQCRVADVAAPTRNALVGGPFGSNLVQTDYTATGVPVIRGQNMGVGRWVGGKFVFVSEEKAQQLSPNTARPGDLVFTQRGTIGQVALVPSDRFERYVISQSQMKLTVDTTKADPVCLYYVFTSQEHQEHIRQNAIQTGVPHTNLQHLRNTPLRLPSLNDQRAIGHVLSTLDDKIELNRRMNETLQAIAQALFKAMFIDATANGLPNGWQEGKFYRLATLSRETINPGEFSEETFDHYSIPAFDEGRLPKTEAGVQIKSNKFVVPTNAVMISKLNPRIPRVWLPKVNAARRSVSSTEFLIAIPKPGISREYIYGLCSSPSFLDVFATLVTGTSGSHQRVKAEYLLAMDVEIGPTERIGEYSAHTKPLLDRIAHNLQESRTLAALRDALLPRLLSGELRVRMNN